MHRPDVGSLSLFVAVVLITAICMVAGLVWATPRPQRMRTLLLSTTALALWMAATAILPLSGLPLSVDPVALVVGPMMILNGVLAVAVGLSPWGRRLAGLPIVALVAFHLFRLPLELVLHLWADQGTVPMAMSWGGQNLDVLTPVLGLLILPFAKRVPWLVVIFELVGIGMLLNIMRIVALHTPGSPLWLDDGRAPLLLGAYFPTLWIATVCVFGAISGHVVIARWLLARLRPAAAATALT